MTRTNKVSLKGKKPYKSWLKDGVNGGPCSMQVLVRWLAYKPNYKRWKREDYSMDRVPKKDLLEEIIDKLRQVGIYHRLAKDVASKISTLQSNYRLARKWSETEGRRLKHRNGGKGLYQDELLKRFPYWNDLHPVFGFSNSAMDLDNLIEKSSAAASTTATAPTTAAAPTSAAAPTTARHYSLQSKCNSNYSISTDDEFQRFLYFGRKKEMERMQKSRDMLHVLRQTKLQGKTREQERLSLQYEKRQVEREFISCMYKAGFTPSEALCFIK